MTVNELMGAVGAVISQVTKAKDEIVARITRLEETIGNVTLPDEVRVQLEELKGIAQALDDINPDTPVGE